MAKGSRGNRTRAGTTSAADAQALSRRRAKAGAAEFGAAASAVAEAPGKTGRSAGARSAPAAEERLAELGSEPRSGVDDGTAAAAADGESAAPTLGMAEFAIAQAPEQLGVDTAGRQDRVAPDEHPLQGYIDEANSNRITGWVWDPRRPETRISLELVDGDTQLVKVTADRYRSDLP